MATKAILNLSVSQEKIENMIYEWNKRYLEGETSEELLHGASRIISNIKIL